MKLGIILSLVPYQCCLGSGLNNSHAQSIYTNSLLDFPPPPSQKRQPQRTHHTQPHHRPPRHNHLPIRHLRPRIPNQMPQPIESVEREWKRHRALEQHLRDNRPGGEGGGQGGGFEMPAEEGRDEVGGAEDVDSAGEGGTGDAVEGAGVPGYLGAVDGEVGGDLGVLVLGVGGKKRG